MTGLLVFDLDGTLVDTFDDIAAAANHALRAIGRQTLPVQEVRRHVGNGGRRLMADLIGDDAPPETIDRAFLLWKDYYSKHLTDFARPYPGVAEGLAALRNRKWRTAVLSNKVHELVVRIVHNLQLAPLLDAIQGEAPPLPRKPDPAVLATLMQRFAAAPADTRMIGDGEADAAVAHNANVRFLGVSYGVNPPEYLRQLGARAVYDSFAALVDGLT